jgi:hypothetical protein
MKNREHTRVFGVCATSGPLQAALPGSFEEQDGACDGSVQGLHMRLQWDSYRL